MRQRMAAPTTFLTTVVLIVLGASSVDASAAVADASVGGLDVLARWQALVKPLEPAVVRDLELSAPFPQPMPELAPRPVVEEHPRVETITSIPQAGLPNADDGMIVFDEVEDSVERSMRVLELPAFRSVSKRSALQTPSGRAAMFGASSVDVNLQANANVPGPNDLDLARLQALVKQLEPAVVKDRGPGQRSRRRSKKELAAPQPMPAEEAPHIETIKSIPQEGFPNADDVIIVFDEVEASVERALRHLTSLDASPAPSPGSLREKGSGEVGSGEMAMTANHMPCSSCANRYAGGVCLVPLAGSECPDDPWTYANCSGPTAVGDFCEADGEELSTDPFLDNCNGDFDLYKRVECIMPCSSCPNGNAGGVCLVPIVYTMCPDEPWTYANCSVPMAVGDFCEADDGELSTNTMLNNCNGDYDFYKRIECNDDHHHHGGGGHHHHHATPTVLECGAAPDAPDGVDAHLAEVRAACGPLQPGGAACPDSCREPFTVLALYYDTCGVPPPAEHETAKPGCAAGHGDDGQHGSGAVDLGSGDVPPPPLSPGSQFSTVTGTQVVITFKVAGDVSDFDQDMRDNIKARLMVHFSCYPPECHGTLRVTPASVNLELELISTAPDASALLATVEEVRIDSVESLSKLVGATVEEGPKVAVTEGVTVVVTLAAPSPPPPLPPKWLSPPSPLVAPPPPPPPVTTPKRGAGVLDDESNMTSLGWTAWMGIGGGAFICLCLSTLWASNLYVARRKRLESGGRLHANVFGVATRNRWGSSKSDMGEVAVTVAGESSELGARVSGVGDSPGTGVRRHTTMEAEEIALHLDADPDRALAASHSSPALNSRASPDREELIPMGISLPAPSDGSSSPRRSKLERLRESFCGKSSDIEGGGATSGPSVGGITRSISCEPGSGGEAGARSALERAVQSRVRRQASINRSQNLALSSDGQTVQTDGGAAARMPALNLLRSFMNEVSEGADSVARRMSGGGSDAAPSTWRQKRKPSAPSASGLLAAPAAPAAAAGPPCAFCTGCGKANEDGGAFCTECGAATGAVAAAAAGVAPATSAPPSWRGSSTGVPSSSGDAPSGLPQWNGSSATSLADEDYSSNYPADVDAEAKGGDSPLAFQKWRAQMRAEGYDDSELTKEAHQSATRSGSSADLPAPQPAQPVAAPRPAVVHI